MPRLRFSEEEELVTWVSGQQVRLFRLTGVKRDQSAIDNDFKVEFHKIWDETFPDKRPKTRTGAALRTK